ncbi:hypothetical protein F8388_009233 [Cannabis sativa]|nr:hypothetical protein F8388_009233 [Cannabis sativa]
MEMVKKEEYLKDLLELLKSTMKERDETIYELHYLESMMLKCINDQPPQPQNNSPISTMPDAKTNSDSSIISESPNHFSADETYLNYSHQGSYSPQLSNNMAEYSTQIDLGSDVIENLSQGKPLPRQGKLLQAVLDTGTVLPHNLLPTRRNRPPPSQPFQILPEGAGAGEDRTKQAEAVTTRAAKIVGTMRSILDLFTIWDGKHMTSVNGSLNGILTNPFEQDLENDDDGDMAITNANSGANEATATVTVNIIVHVVA